MVIQLNVRPLARPASPPQYSRSKRRERKRDGRNIDKVTEGTETLAQLERQVKKLKLSYDVEGGYRTRGLARECSEKNREDACGRWPERKGKADPTKEVGCS
jgi:hypothetical protein